jgi:hypothetical protein
LSFTTKDDADERLLLVLSLRDTGFVRFNSSVLNNDVLRHLIFFFLALFDVFEAIHSCLDALLNALLRLDVSSSPNSQGLILIFCFVTRFIYKRVATTKEEYERFQSKSPRG